MRHDGKLSERDSFVVSVDIVNGGRIYGGRCGSRVSNGFDLTDDLVFGVRLAFAERHQEWSTLRILFGTLSNRTFDFFS